MDSNKILSAPLLDIIFDGRNKSYGAYELRKSNSVRTRTALSITISFVALVLSMVSMANSNQTRREQYKIVPGHELTILKEIPPEQLPEPEPETPVETEPVETIIYTAPAIVPDDLAHNLMTDIASLDSVQISTETNEGRPDIGETPPKELDRGTGIVPAKENTESDEPRTIVEVPARFSDNWQRFLMKHLNPETPVENNAGAGRYSVVVQFVVDREGVVSDIRALTNHGFGMEDEAIRVLKKSPKWEPAIQNGHTVKAYHRQVITFEVNEE